MTAPDLFDTHAHLHFPEFAGDLDAVLDRARAAGVRRMLTIGTDVATSRAAVALAAREPDVWAAVGIHPHEAADADVCEHGGIMHCFSGDLGIARRCLDLGLLISLAGPVTYPKPGALPEVARSIPGDRLVVETDCPYLPPQPYRGKRNEPAYIAITAARVAELRGEPLGDLAARMSENARALFRL